MLRRKLIRDLRANFWQFFSIFILAALAMAMYVTFEGHVLSENAARDIFHEEAALSDLWVYSEGFPESQLETVRNLPFVESAQLRTSLTGSAPDYDGAQVDICLEDEDVLDHPVCLEGEPFDPTEKEGVWLSQTFADLRGIKVGDTICWHLYDKNDWYEAKVGVIYRSSESQGIIMLTLNSMMNSNGENFDYNLILRWQVYVLAAAFVLVTSCLISFMFARRIRRLDMVEVLKGVE